MKPCAERKLVDRHFEGAIDVAGERRMREHLGGCEGCREYYERHLMLARLDPRAAKPEDRLARGLGVPAPRADRSRRLGWMMPASVLAVAAVAIGLAIWPRSQPEFASRGGGAEVLPSIEVYRAVGAVSEPVAGKVAVSDELAFQYRNVRERKRLMLFAVDATGAVHWYYPEWTDAAKSPVGIEIQPGQHDLPEAVTHPLAPGPMRIVALFTDDPALTVKEVEDRITVRRGAEGLGFPGADEVVVKVDVEEVP